MAKCQESGSFGIQLSFLFHFLIFNFLNFQLQLTCNIILVSGVQHSDQTSWDITLESLRVLVFPGEKENNCICIRSWQQVFIKKVVSEKNILKLLGLFFSAPRLNTEYFSRLLFVCPVGGGTLTKAFICICRCVHHQGVGQGRRYLGLEKMSSVLDLVVSYWLPENPLQCWEYIWLFERRSSSKSNRSFHKCAKRKKQESVIISKNESL